MLTPFTYSHTSRGIKEKLKHIIYRRKDSHKRKPWGTWVAQVIISGPWDRAQCQAPCSARASVSLCSSAPPRPRHTCVLFLSLSNTYIHKSCYVHFMLCVFSQSVESLLFSVRYNCLVATASIMLSKRKPF